MFDLGEPVPLGVDVTDAAGDLVDADTITLTVTLPDGTAVTPTVPNPPTTTGKYQYDYVTVQAGLHRYRFATTTPTTAYADVFNVVSADWPAIVGLAETKKHLNIEPDDTSADEELRGFILSASAVVEDVVGAVARRTVVETCSGGSGLVRLATVPVLSVDQVLADGTLVDPGDYSFAASGMVVHRWGCWPTGLRNVEVTYTAGRLVVPPNLLDGVKELIRINWRPQEGGNYSPFDGGGEDDFGVSRATEGSLQGQIRLGFFVPNTVTERLMPQRRGPVVM
jgi:hypothetical protein